MGIDVIIPAEVKEAIKIAHTDFERMMFVVSNTCLCQQWGPVEEMSTNGEGIHWQTAALILRSIGVVHVVQFLSRIGSTAETPENSWKVWKLGSC